MQAATLVVSPNANERNTYAGWLRADGHAIAEASSTEEAVAQHRRGTYPVTVAEVDSPGLDGEKLIRSVRAGRPRAQFVVLGSGGALASLVAAIKAGATDFLAKPVLREALLESVRRIGTLNGNTSTDDDAPRWDPPIIACSPQLKHVLSVVARVAPRDTTVLITGESGTGKEVIARAVHQSSSRADRPMLTINCAAIPETLLESELFGYRKGAFTGAAADKDGLLATADGGTLFLDEVAELALPTQAKLLRFLQDGTYFRLGCVTPSTANVRLISATNASLLDLVESGRFRRDLYYRLSVFPVYIPPLRERTDDVVPLAQHFLRQIAEQERRDMPALSDEGVRYLTTRSWRGNVRELQSAIVRAVIMSDKSLLTSADFHLLDSGPRLQSDHHHLPDDGVNLQDLNRKLVAEALKRTDNNVSAAARLLGLSRTMLRSRLKRYQIDLAS